MRGARFLSIVAIGCGTALAAPSSDSLYNLRPALTDQRGQATTLEAAARGPALVSMFYASCQHVCPMLVSSAKSIDSALAPAERARLRVLFVSFDPERDTPAALAAVAQRHAVDQARWTFARAPAGEVRALAASLGIQYRRLADGEFNHSTIITLLDRQGRIVAHTEHLGAPEPEFVAAVRQALVK